MFNLNALVLLTLVLGGCSGQSEAACPGLRDAIAASFSGGSEFQLNNEGQLVLPLTASDGRICVAIEKGSGDFELEVRSGAGRQSKVNQHLNAGEWIYGTPEQTGHTGYLNFFVGQSGNLNVEGDASYTNVNGSTNVGYFSGVADKENGDVGTTFYPESENAINRSSDCYLSTKLIGKYLIVSDSGKPLGNCGGQNVTFTGIYVSRD